MVNREEQSADQKLNQRNAVENDDDSDAEAKSGFITFLSKLDKLDMLTEDALAKQLGVTRRTIRRMIACFSHKATT